MGACPGTPVLPPSEDERISAPSVPWAGVGVPSDLTFPRGVQSGDAHKSGLRLWTWCEPQLSVTVHISEWDGAQWGPPESIEVPDGEDGFIHFELTNVPSDAIIGYQFSASNGEYSHVGQGRIALEGAGTIRFGIISCTKSGWAPFPVVSELAKQPLDFCVHLGDTSYNDGASSLEAFREKWANTLNQTGYRDLQQSCSSMITWDDHEVYNNWNREEISDSFLAIATRAFFETLPIRQSDNSEIGLWRTLSWGETAEFFVLDCRGERYPSRDEYLSEKQLQWLIDGLCSSKATWKFVVNSVPITNLPPVFDVEIAIKDRWEGFPVQRERLITALTDCGAKGIVFLGGDIHMSAFTHLEPTGPGHQLLEFIVGPSGQRPNVLGVLIDEPDQFPFTGAENCAAIVEISSQGLGSIELINEVGDSIAQARFNTHGQYTEVWKPEV